jgi:hypothetical protein
MGEVSVDASQRRSTRSFAGFMFVIAGLYAIAVAVLIFALDDFLSRSWDDWSRTSPYGFTPVTVACVAAAASFLLAAGISRRRPRTAAVFAGAFWLAGLLSSLLLPAWQHSQGLVGTSILVPFIGIWLVAAAPVGAAIVYELLSTRRLDDGAPA